MFHCSGTFVMCAWNETIGGKRRIEVEEIQDVYVYLVSGRCEWTQQTHFNKNNAEKAYNTAVVSVKVRN